MRWLLGVACLTLACSQPDRAYVLDGGDLVAVGAAFAQQRGCAMCHYGAGTLAGNAAPVPGTMAFASNLTPDRTTGLGGWADIEIVRALRVGLDNMQGELCPSMPRYATMGDVEADALVAYLRSLPPVANAVPASMCPPIKPVPQPDMAMAPPDM